MIQIMYHQFLLFVLPVLNLMQKRKLIITDRWDNMRFKTDFMSHKYLIVLLPLNKILTQSSVKLPVILFVLMMRQCQMIHTLVQSMMLQFNVTLPLRVLLLPSVIKTEPQRLILSHRSLYCRISPFTKGKAQLSQREIETSRELSCVWIHVEWAIGYVKHCRLLQTHLPNITNQNHCWNRVCNYW